MKISYYMKALSAGLLLFTFVPMAATAQFTAQWLDIGTFHSTWTESGAQHEGNSSAADGMEWPSILRNSSHFRAKALWLGTKDWTDANGQSFPYFVARIGPRTAGADVTYPVQNVLISKTEDTVVEVDGALSFDNVAVVDEIDPGLPADRMVHNIHNTYIGITVDRRAYAYVNQAHDDYNIIEYIYTNTGNTDEDEDIELESQNLKETYFFRIHRWRGNLQGAWTVSGGMVWGKFSMIDVVGDGHAEYPITFTSQYLWIGIDPETQGDYDRFGGSLFNEAWWAPPADSIGRLTGASYIGRATIHADASPTDSRYIRCTMATIETCQPATMGFMDSDEALTADGSSHEDYYEWGIRTRENPDRIDGGSQHMWPHYADRIEPTGVFWEPKNDASTGKQGGHAVTTAYGPYDFAPGESVRLVVVEGVGGLTIDASIRIGRAFKLGGLDRDSDLIRYDANGDGMIQTGTFDPSINQMDMDGDGMFDTFGHGLEEMTKNQWVVTARDSMLQTLQRGINLYAASNGMSAYPIPEAPHAPSTFSVVGRPDKVEVRWTNPAGGPARTKWLLYRTSRYEDYIYESCLNLDSQQFTDGSNPRNPADPSASGQQHCGYEMIASLDAGANSYDDTDLNRGTDYYYYLQAVGGPQPMDPDGISGTPTGAPLRSSRSLTQTYQPVNLKRPAYGSTGTVEDARIVPNPVNLGADATVRFDQEDRVAFFNIPGNCTIKIYTEIGELVHTIEHNDGSGDELWNLTTTSRQLLVSGIYIAVISDNDTGDEAIRKFTVIR